MLANWIQTPKIMRQNPNSTQITQLHLQLKDTREHATEARTHDNNFRPKRAPNTSRGTINCKWPTNSKSSKIKERFHMVKIFKKYSKSKLLPKKWSHKQQQRDQERKTQVENSPSFRCLHFSPLQQGKKGENK